jgi:cytochrome c peroxidase
VRALFSYDFEQAVLPDLPEAAALDTAALADINEITAIAEANEIAPVKLTDDEISALVAFLESLTDESSRAGRLGVPENVPSGLPVD